MDSSPKNYVTFSLLEAVAKQLYLWWNIVFCFSSAILCKWIWCCPWLQVIALSVPMTLVTSELPQ